VIEASRKADPAAASSEWDSEFRSDLSAFLSDELIEQAIDHARPLELPVQRGIVYTAFTDASGGAGRDAYTISIGHRRATGTSLISCVAPEAARRSTRSK
jgi:hypothetical protein